MMNYIKVRDLKVRDEAIIEGVDVKVWEVTNFPEGVTRVRGTNYDKPGHEPYLKDLPSTTMCMWVVDGDAERTQLEQFRNTVGTGAEVDALNAYEKHIHGES